MRELMILAAEEANASTVVNEFEELLLRIFVVTIMFGLGATAANAQDAATSIVKTETQAGQFYSSQLSLDQGFPFSDIVETNGGLVFISGLVGTDETG